MWARREGLRYITGVISGKNSPRAYNNYKRYAGRPDKWYEPKPIIPMKTEWHHELNPASCGGHPYDIRERCRSMIPVVTQVADELHENPTHNPYLRMRQVFEAVRDGKPLPTPPRERSRWRGARPATPGKLICGILHITARAVAPARHT